MKVCKMCNEEKEFSEYSIVQKKYYNSYCKSCTTKRFKSWKEHNPIKKREIDKRYYKDNLEYAKNYALSLKDGLYHVYIRKDGYVGATDNLIKRTIWHKQITCVLHSTPSINEASELEEFLHDLGYKGRGKKTYAQQLG